MTAPGQTTAKTSPNAGLEEEELPRPSWSFSGRRGRAVPAPAQPAGTASLDSSDASAADPAIPADQTSSQHAYVLAHARETKGASVTATVPSSRESTLATLRRLLIGPPTPAPTAAPAAPAAVLRAQTAAEPAGLAPVFTLDEREMPVVDVTFELDPEPEIAPAASEVAPITRSAPTAQAVQAAPMVAPKVASDTALRAMTPPNVRRTVTAASPTEAELRERIAAKRERLQTLLQQLDA